MSIIELDADQKKEWKKEFRALLRRCGKQQQEVAIDMARIVSTMGKPVDNHAFISSLSRFANGKDSAFPGWFYKEEARLTPMANAMGLSSSQELWEIIHRITQNQTQSMLWHPAFPNLNVHIPVYLHGKSLDIVALQMYKKAKQTPGVYPIWILGPRGSGKDYAAQQIREHFSRLTSQREENLQLRIHCLEMRSHDSSHARHSFSLSPWGYREYKILFNQLLPHLAPSQQSFAQSFLEEYSKLNECISLYAYDAIFLFRMVIDGGVPTSAKELGLRLMRYFWKRSVERGFDLIALSFEDWIHVWGGIFSAACLKRDIPHHEILNIMTSYCRSSAVFNQSTALKLIQDMASAPKKERERLGVELSRWLMHSNAEQLLHIFEREGLLEKEGEQWRSSVEQRMMLWAAHSYVLRNEILAPHSYLLHHDWVPFLNIMMVLGLSKETLNNWLSLAPSSLWLEVYAVRLRYALHVDDVWSEPELIEIWSHVLYAEIHQLNLVQEYRTIERSDILIAFSKKYAAILPQLSFEGAIDDLRALVQPKLQKQVLLLTSARKRSIQALAPYQIPPKNYIQWQTWKRISQKGPRAWKVLSYFAHLGEPWAQKLLGEGDGSSSAPWIHAPVIERLLFLGRSDVRKNTLRAIRNISVDIWQNKSHQKFDWVPESSQELLDACARCHVQKEVFSLWSHHSSIAQQIVQYRQPFLAYCAIWFFYETSHHEDLGVMYQSLLHWCHQDIKIEDGILHQEGVMIPVGKCTKQELKKEMHVLLLRIAQLLYQCGESEYLFQIWEGNLFGHGADAFSILTKNYDRNVLLHWIEKAPTVLPRLNDALCADGKYLRLAWRLDRKGKRRRELRSFALTFSRLPQWTLRDAKKTLQETNVWPEWLSPHRPEVQDMLLWMTKQAKDRHKIWLGNILHRQIANHPLFLEALRQWALEDPRALTYSSQGGQSFLSAASTPLHSSFELVQLLLSLSKRPEWFVKACCRLWSLSYKTEENIALLLLFVLEEQKEIETIFVSDWLTCSPRLLQELTRLWAENVSSEQIIQRYWDEPTLRPYLQKNLLKIREPKFMATIKEEYTQHLSMPSFELLMEGADEEIPEVLTSICTRRPEKRRDVLQFVQRYLIRHHHLGLLYWLKEELNRVQ